MTGLNEGVIATPKITDLHKLQYYTKPLTYIYYKTTQKYFTLRLKSLKIYFHYTLYLIIYQ